MNPYVSKFIQQQRLEICKECPSYQEPKFFGIKIPIFQRCGECGCFLKAKTKLRFVGCPKKKWKSGV